jgi:hypothetical protein
MYANASSQTTLLTSNEKYINISMPEEEKTDNEDCEEYPPYSSRFQRLMLLGQEIPKIDDSENEIKSRRGEVSKRKVVRSGIRDIFLVSCLSCTSHVFYQSSLPGMRCK